MTRTPSNPLSSNEGNWQPRRVSWEQSRADKAHITPAQETQPATSQRQSLPSPAVPAKISSPSNTMPFTPGTLLYGDRYRLVEKQEPYQWSQGAYEVTWKAQDLQKNGLSVSISEAMLPGRGASTIQLLVRTAIRTLSLAGNTPRVPALLDVFRDQGCNFFVFEAISGETLLDRIQRSGRLPESEILAYCLQLLEILAQLSQHAIVHGLIRPEYIVMPRPDTWYLTNFSSVVAAAASQFLVGATPTMRSVYAAPEFALGQIDAMTDAYAVMAIAFHAATGQPPTIKEDIPNSLLQNSQLSAHFQAILAKALHPTPQLRYQQIEEIKQDLLTLKPGNAVLPPKREERRSMRQSTPPAIAGSPNASQREEAMRQRQAPALPGSSGLYLQEGMSQRRQYQPLHVNPTPVQETSASAIREALTAMALVPEEEEVQAAMLPLPQDLPPLPTTNTTMIALCWLVGILICLSFLIIIQ